MNGVIRKRWAIMAALLIPMTAVAATNNPRLGASTERVTPEIAKAHNLGETYGVLVDRVASNTPGASAGLQAGDIIVDVNGEGMANDRDLEFKLSSMQPGTEIRLTVFRDGALRVLKVTLDGDTK